MNHRKHLQKLAVGDWMALHWCAHSRTLWKEWYPHGERHGGGPPRLDRTDEAQAAATLATTGLTHALTINQ